MVHKRCSKRGGQYVLYRKRYRNTVMREACPQKRLSYSKEDRLWRR